MSRSETSNELTAAVTRVLRERRTVHEFLPAPPPREALLRAIELARWAPNHRLTEPWRFYLLGRETAAAITLLNAEAVAAKHNEAKAQEKLARWQSIPGWMVVTCEKSEDGVQALEDYGACCCAIQNLTLALWSEGIGVKWSTGAVTRDPAFYDLIWVDPSREQVVAMLWYGYPAAVPAMDRRKSVSELIVNLP